MGNFPEVLNFNWFTCTYICRWKNPTLIIHTEITVDHFKLSSKKSVGNWELVWPTLNWTEQCTGRFLLPPFIALGRACNFISYEVGWLFWGNYGNGAIESSANLAPSRL